MLGLKVRPDAGLIDCPECSPRDLETLLKARRQPVHFALAQLTQLFFYYHSIYL